MIKCRKCPSNKTRPIGPNYSDFTVYRCQECGHDSIVWRTKTQPLNSFPPEFWRIKGVECVKHPKENKPVTIEQALWEISTKDWDKMVRSLFSNSFQPASLIGVEQIMDIIKETNTCTDLNFPVEVWIDKKGDFKIKVYK